MFDTVEECRAGETDRHQRARGEAHVTLASGCGQTRLRGLRQSGSAKAFLPRAHGGRCEVVYLNTAGGLTGGDRFSLSLDAGAGTSVTGTTQTAERAYAASSGAAALNCRITAGANADVAWLPQETILFDRAALDRRTVVDLDPTARFLMAETIILGRAAMGEQVTDLHLRDRREIRRGGRVVVLEPLLLGSAQLARRDNPALLGSAVAFASIYLIGTDAVDHAPKLRHLLREMGRDDVTAGLSAWSEKLVIRLLARDAYALRQVVTACLSELTDGGLPRVWQT